MKLRAILSVSAALAAVGAQAGIVFGNVQINGLNAGATWSSAGNSISFFTPNAIVTDGGVGSLLIQYDAATDGNPINEVLAAVDFNVLGSIQGNGSIDFAEEVLEITGIGGSEVAPNPIGLVDPPAWHAGSFWSGSIPLSRLVTAVRVKKTFFLSALPDQPLVLDLAGVGLVNQSIETVPEPASMAVLSIGAVAFLRRRARR